MKFWVSELALYETCPYCYFLRYVAEVEQPPNENLVFGSLVHNLLESYHTGKKIETDDEYALKFLDAYKQYYPSPEYEHIEKSIEIDLVHPVTKEPLGAVMSGRIDLIKDGWVIDHKTSSSLYKTDRAETDFQLIAYAYMYYRTFGRHPNGIRFNVLVKNKTPKVQIVDSYVDVRDYLLWYERVERIVRGIRSEDFYPGRSWWHAYDICEANVPRAEIAL